MYLLLLAFGGLLGAAGVVLAPSAVSLRDGAFDAAILTPALVAMAGGLLLIGLGAGLRTLQRIERTLASRPMPRALPIAEGAKAAESVETSREPVRVPFAPKVSHEVQPSVAARDIVQDQSTEAAGSGRISPAIVAIPSAAARNAIVEGAQRSSKNGNGAAGLQTGLRLPSSLRRADSGERPSEPALDALWPKGPRSSRPLKAPSVPTAQGSGVTPIPPPQIADAVHARASTSNLDSAAISVLKSGVVNGMPYTLYSDGSIEAQLAEGTLRFGSITELRNHIEQSA
jgi:hypothetical protein